VAALEVALHDRPAKPTALRDCLQVITSHGDEVRRTASSWQVDGVAALGFVMAAQALDAGHLLPGWVETTPLRRIDGWLYRSFHADRTLPYLAAALVDLPDLRSRLAYLRRAVPDRQDIAERGGWRALFARHRPGRHGDDGAGGATG
jgi:hypothetical protein